MTLFYKTDWQYDTSKDQTVSAFVSGSKGIIQLKNDVTKSTMQIYYKAFSAGLSKGLPFGYSESKFETQSSGTCLAARNPLNWDFGFPCHGWLLSMGGTAGVLSPQADNAPPDPAFANGGSATIVLFGAIPFAYVKCVGGFAGTTPGIGVSGGMAGFSLDPW